MFKLSPLAAWTPGPGPIYSAITSTWNGFNLPTPPLELRTWVSNGSPLSTQKAVVAAIGSYLLLIFGGRELMKSRAPFTLTGPFRLHNAYLSIGSALLLGLMVEEILPLYLKHGFYWSMCSTSAFTPRLVTYYMINYYIKYVELIDTVFLTLKKKPLTFLHVFHHAATAVLCFTQLEGETSVQWVVIVLNLTVHVLMYYYYWAAAGGRRVWWKQYLTGLQITQFVIDLAVVFFCTYQRLAVAYAPGLPHVSDCAGTTSAALFGCGLLGFYLILFIQLWRLKYPTPGAADRTSRAAPQQVANGNPASNTRGSARSRVVRQDARGTTVITHAQ